MKRKEIIWEGEETDDVLAARIYDDCSVRFFEEGAWRLGDDPMARELAQRILAEREQSSRESSSFEAMRQSRDFYRGKVEQREQQLEAQKQIEESLRAEIRALKAEPAGRLVSHETRAAWESALTNTINFLATIDGSSHRGYYSTGWAGQRLCALRDWLRAPA